jgi:hypothetical protein
MRTRFLTIAALIAVSAPLPTSAQNVSVDDAGYVPPANMASGGYYYDQPFWTLQAGAEATYLSLEMRGLEDANPTGLDLAFGFEAAPRLWLQAENVNGFGAQVRYWQYDADADASGIVSEVVTAGITTDAQVDMGASAELYTVDAEATQTFQLGAFDMMASLGGRHAAIGTDSVASVVVLSGPSLFDAGSAHLANEFHGGGLTASLAGVLPLGESWSLFGNVRGSALWGHEHRSALLTILIPGGGPTTAANTLVVDDADLAIVELQAGGQWEHLLAYNRGLVFARLAFEYQNWNVTATLPPGPLSGDSSLDADLYGISLAVGLER